MTAHPRIYSSIVATALSLALLAPGCAMFAPKKEAEKAPVKASAKRRLKHPDVSQPEAEDQVSQALKQALCKAADVAVQRSSVKDGFRQNPKIRIPFPPAIAQVEKALANMGMTKLTDRFVVSLNDAASIAAGMAKTHFIQAVQRLEFDDPDAILEGVPTAATDFLKTTQAEVLRAKLAPLVHQGIQQAQVMKYWAPVAQTYNSLPIMTKADPDFDVYLTERTLDGLLALIAEHEAAIRLDPEQRTTPLLHDVFESRRDVHRATTVRVRVLRDPRFPG